LLIVGFIAVFIILFFPQAQYDIAYSKAKDQLSVFLKSTIISIFDVIQFLDKESADIVLNQLNDVPNIDFITIYLPNKTEFTILNSINYNEVIKLDSNLLDRFSATSEIIDFEDRIMIYSDIKNEDDIIGRILISFFIKDIKEATLQAYGVALIAVLLAIILSVLLSVLTSRPILKPIESLQEFFHKMVTGKGDLTKRLVVDSKDEFGEMANEFNRFLDSQSLMIMDIKNVAEIVMEQIKTIESMSEKNNLLIAHLTENFEYISDNAYSIFKGASLNVETAEIVSKKSESTIDQSVQSQKSAEKSINLMESIKREVGELEVDMTSLHEQSKKIKTISDVLKDITDRTNILALNTTIEANKAGIAGGGFIIIAEEIQNLAEQSSESLDSINKINHKILGSLNQSFKLTISSANSVDEGVKNIKDTGSQIMKSVSYVRDNLGKINEVLGIAKEQQSQIKSIVSNVDKSSDNIHLIQESVNNTLTSVKEQKFLITNLKEIMDNFKVGS
jgi:methyl-accepting chemotaxis protein